MGFWNFFGVLMVMAAIGLLSGFVIGRDSKPWRKTRYFVDCDGTLRRWKFGSNKTQPWCEGWLNGSLSVQYIEKHATEISPLRAYQMFPQAFKK